MTIFPKTSLLQSAKKQTILDPTRISQDQPRPQARLNRRTKIKIVTLFLVFIASGEVHNFFKTSAPVDVFLFLDWKCDADWVCRDVATKLQATILAGVCVLGLSTQLKRFAWLIWAFTVVDLLLYFVNYNHSSSYPVIYLAMAGALFLLFK